VDKKRRFVARIEATPKGLDVRYVVTSLKVGAKHLYETMAAGLRIRQPAAGTPSCSFVAVAFDFCCRAKVFSARCAFKPSHGIRVRTWASCSRLDLNRKPKHHPPDPQGHCRLAGFTLERWPASSRNGWPRETPPSVRFLGRKIYLAAMVVLIAITQAN